MIKFLEFLETFNTVPMDEFIAFLFSITSLITSQNPFQKRMFLHFLLHLPFEMSYFVKYCRSHQKKQITRQK